MPEQAIKDTSFIVIVRHPFGADKTARNLGRDVLNDLATGMSGVVTLPDGWDLEITKVEGCGPGNVHRHEQDIPIGRKQDTPAQE